MTDKAIIKALEYCSTGEPCFFCFYQKQCEESDLAQHALDLINRQQAEIEELKAEYEKVYEQAEADILGNLPQGGASCHWCIDKHKEYAIKECLDWVLSLFPEDKNFTTISRFTVKQKLKEMVGE
jgi:hypothetical protein